jgi:hypothetical protein
MVLGVEVFEIACNWRTVTNYKKTERLQTLDRSQAVPICEKPTSVLLEIPNKPHLDIMMLRDWMNANYPRAFKMYNRFMVDEGVYRIHRQFLGTNFRFLDQTVAATFKLWWV